MKTINSIEIFFSRQILILIIPHRVCQRSKDKSFDYHTNDAYTDILKIGTSRNMFNSLIFLLYNISSIVKCLKF